MCEVQKLLPVTLSQLLCDTENLTGFAILHAEGPTSCYAVHCTVVIAMFVPTLQIIIKYF